MSAILSQPQCLNAALKTFWFDFCLVILSWAIKNGSRNTRCAPPNLHLPNLLPQNLLNQWLRKTHQHRQHILNCQLPPEEKLADRWQQEGRKWTLIWWHWQKRSSIPFSRRLASWRNRMKCCLRRQMVRIVFAPWAVIFLHPSCVGCRILFALIMLIYCNSLWFSDAKCDRGMWSSWI